MVKTKSTADLMMLVITVFWGASYLFMKIGLDSIQAFNLIALRFGLAFILAAILFYRRLIRADLKTISSGFVLGLLLFLSFTFIIFGVKYTSTSNASFLVSLRVIVIPILSALFMKKVPDKKVLWGVCLSIIGIGLLTLNSRLSINHGDVLCILSAIVLGTHIIVTGKLTKEADSITLGVIQLGFTGALGLIFSWAFETPKLPTTPESWLSVLALSILCSALGFIVQTTAQKHTNPTHTGLIFSLEPVFAAIFAILFGNEALSARGYIGAVIVLMGVLNAEVDIIKLILPSRLQLQTTKASTYNVQNHV